MNALLLTLAMMLPGGEVPQVEAKKVTVVYHVYYWRTDREEARCECEKYFSKHNVRDYLFYYSCRSYRPLRSYELRRLEMARSIRRVVQVRPPKRRR